MTVSRPSIARCLELMEEYTMLENIRDHSHTVARVAETVYYNLKAGTLKDRLPPLGLVLSGALLHDIAKTDCLARLCDHAEVGAMRCQHHGYPEVAEIVSEHVNLKEYDSQRYKKGIFLAKEIVFYADKRVLHSSIVELEERLEYIIERYGRNNRERCSVIRYNFTRCRELESWLCHHSGVKRENLLHSLNPSPFCE